MAFDAKAATPDTTFAVGTAFLLGADSQSASDPSVYPASDVTTAIKDYILEQANTFTATQTIAQGTITDPALNLSGTVTWNDAADTFTAWNLNVTDTASAAASLLMDLQIGGSSKAGIIKTGQFFQANGSGLLQVLGYGKAASTVGGGISFDWTNFGVVLRGGANSDVWVTNAKFSLAANCVLAWSATSNNAVAGAELILAKDAANVLAQRNSTNAQTFNWYGNYVGTTDYHRGALKVAKTTLSNVSGATATASNLIPAGACVIGVTTKITTALGTGNGTTGYTVGDGTTADKFGTASAVTLGTTTDNASSVTATAISIYAAATNVVLTAVGGNFDATGVIDVNVFYLIAQAD